MHILCIDGTNTINSVNIVQNISCFLCKLCSGLKASITVSNCGGYGFKYRTS